MGYFRANTAGGHKPGEWADTDPVSLQASAAITTTAAGSWIEVADRGDLRLTLDVTAVSGTNPTLDVEIETASDSSGSNLDTLGSFSQRTATGSQRLKFHGVDRFVRYRRTIGGTSTPTFTFSLTGEAV